MSDENDSREPRELEPQQPDEVEQQEDEEPDGLTGVPVPDEILEKLPRQQRAELLQFVASMTSTSMMPAANPLVSKFNSQHIDSLIGLQGQESTLEYKDRRESRYVLSVLLVIFLVVAVGFGVFLALQDEKDLLQNLVQVAVSFAGGFGLGTGFRAWRNR